MKEYKIAVIGSGGVGKTALVCRFVQGVFPNGYDPTIEDFYRKQLDSKMILNILDTAGTEQFTAMRDLYIKNREGLILVYSVISAPSFIALQSHWDQICRAKLLQTATPIVLVGNKSDLDAKRAVPTQDGKALAEKWQCPFFETSAKLGCEVNEIFSEIVQCIEQRQAIRNTLNRKHRCVIL